MSRIMFVVICISTILLWLSEVCKADGCKSRDYGHGSVVCVCDTGYCDTLNPVILPPTGQSLIITSTKAGLRWHTSTLEFRALNEFHNEPGMQFGNKDQTDVELEVHREEAYQHIIGFGGAFTDASGLNIHSLSKQLQEEILRAYYSTDGLEYNLGRVPLAGTDFSTHPYTYNDLNEGESDPTLQHFHLAEEDIKYKIPLIQRAKKLAEPTQLKLFGSAWGAPGWMKDSGKIWGKGKIKPEYLSTWADYHIRFIQSYGQHNLSFWGLTTQNEPNDGLIKGFKFNAVGWTPEEQASWVGRYLGPKLHNAGLGNLKIMILDDNRNFLLSWVDTVMSNSDAANYVSGVAVHWYTDWITPASLLDRTHTQHPNLFMLYTEACTGQWPWQPLKVVLGAWNRAEEYAADIIEALQHWVTGWTDWNLALDLKGGPNWVQNFVDSPIIVNAPKGEFYKQPMYYALAHFTKFLPEGSLRIGLSQKQWSEEDNAERKYGKRKMNNEGSNIILKLEEELEHTSNSIDRIWNELMLTGKQSKKFAAKARVDERIKKEGNYEIDPNKQKRTNKESMKVDPSYGLHYVAFLRPDNSTVAIFLNKGHFPVSIGVKDQKFGHIILKLDPHTITTAAWRE